MVALGETFVLAGWLALPHFAVCRHEHTRYCARCTFLLGAGPIAGCSTVLAAREYCGYRRLVSAVTFLAVFSEEAGLKKTKREKKREGKQQRSFRKK